MNHSENIESELQLNIEKSAKQAKLFSMITFASIAISLLQLIIGLVSKNEIKVMQVFGFVISSVITLVLAINMLRFSKMINQFQQTKDSTFFTLAFSYLKNFFIVLGVIFIILLGLLVLYLLVFSITLILKN